MTTQWYYARGAERHGPVSEEQLHQLVASGQLQPTDLVWRDGMAQWQQAGSIPGLFSRQPQVEGATQATRPAETPEDWRLHLQKPLVIGLSFLFCWPVGLVLVGIHPRISPKTKKIVFGCVGALVVIVMILGGIASSVAYKQAVEANALWENGKHEEAAAMYASLVAGDSGGLLPDSMKPTVYGRLIDHELSLENAAGATKWAEQADKFKVVPKVRSQEGQRLLSSLEEARRLKEQPAQVAGAEPTGRPSEKADSEDEKPSKKPKVITAGPMFGKKRFEIHPEVAAVIDFKSIEVKMMSIEFVLLQHEHSFFVKLDRLWLHGFDKNGTKLFDERIQFFSNSVTVGRAIKGHVTAAHLDEATRIVINGYSNSDSLD